MATPARPGSRLTIWSWALIDAGNSAFTLVIMTAFFPIVFKDVYAKGLDPAESTALLGVFNSISSVVIAIAAPILGSIADQGNLKRGFLMGFTLLGVASCVGLTMAAEGQYWYAGIVFAIGALAFSGNNMFYDALITDVTTPDRYDSVSSFGYGLGYIASVLLFIFNTNVVTNPARYGLSNASSALTVVFLLTGAWWLLFTLPAMFFVKERPSVPAIGGSGGVLMRGFRQFGSTLRELKTQKNILIFLAGYMLYIDGVNTVIKMAVDYGKNLGLENAALLQALVVTQVIAFPATIAFGWLGQRVGPRRMIYAGLVVYCGICVWAFRMATAAEFQIMAAIVGLVQGGVQALSRSFFAALIPEDRSGEYFGFYNMLGKFAAIIGPTLLGVSALVIGSRASIMSLLILFIAGATLLSRVKDPRRA
jgi:UMF1 family MFS transporter